MYLFRNLIISSILLCAVSLVGAADDSHNRKNQHDLSTPEKQYAFIDQVVMLNDLAKLKTYPADILLNTQAYNRSYPKALQPFCIGYEALHGACQEGHYEMVDYLLSIGVDVHGTSDNHFRDLPLFKAASEGKYDIYLRLKAAGCDIHVNGDESIHHAVSANCLEIVRDLVDLGINVNERSALALHRAVEQNHPEIVKFLLSHGSLSNTPRYYESSGQLNTSIRPLKTALIRKHKTIAKMLVAAGADIGQALAKIPSDAAPESLFAYAVIPLDVLPDITDLLVELATLKTQIKMFYQFCKLKNSQAAIALLPIISQAAPGEIVRDEQQNNLLHAAVMSADSNLIRKVFYAFPSLLNKKNAQGEMPLQLAITADGGQLGILISLTPFS